MKFRDIVQLVEKDGWLLKRTSGSHRIYKYPTKPGTVVIAYHGTRDLPEGTLKSILKQADMESRMRDYLVIFEQGKDGGWGAYAPDLPGLGVGAETRDEVDILIREGIRIYIEELLEDGLPIPEPVTTAERVHVAA